MTQADSSLDTLSALGRKLLRAEDATIYRQLVVRDSVMPPSAELLRDLSPRDLLAGEIVDENAAACVLAGLWLRHDALEEAHRICQAVDTPAGSYWHAIVHRRDGDFSNSGYWYNRADSQDVSRTIAARAAQVINPFPADKSVYKLTADGWQPRAFVDLVAQVHDRPDDSRHALCVAIQNLEWQTLFEHCRRGATIA